MPNSDQQPESPESPESSTVFVRRLVAVVVLVNLCVYSLAGWYLYRSLGHQFTTISVLTQNMALTLENNIVGIIDKADMALRSVVDQAERQLVTGGISGTELEAMLLREAARVPGLNSLWMLDARGDLIHGPRDSSGSPVNITDRDYFRWLRDHPDGGLVLTKAVKGRVTKQWVMNIARRVNNPDGSFAGVVLGSFSVKYLTRLFAGINLGPNGTISLRYRDLEGIARFPEPQGFGSTIGQKSTMKELVTSVQAGKAVATFTGRASVDHVVRTYSYRKFSDLPLYILVGRATEDYLGPWREEAAIVAVLTLLFSVMTVIGSRSLARTWRLEKQTEEGLQRVNRELEARVTERTVELSRSNDQMCDLIAGNGDGMVVVDQAGLVCFGNPAAVTLLKKPLNTLIGQPFGLPIADTGSTEIDLVLPDNKICTVDMRVNHIQWLTGPASLVSLRDTTVRKRAEEALAAARDAAEAATRTKSAFLANMSHEIRTPMNAIVGFGQLLRQTELNSRQQDYLHKIEASSRTLLEIINDILDLSKIEASRLELEDVNFSLHEVLDRVADLITELSRRKGLELIFTLASELPDSLRGDPLRLQQILVNLLSNAVKFSEQGQIILSIALSVHVQENRVGLCFSVSDPGIGLSPEQISRLFQPFSQSDSSTTRRYGGTGLGLSICKNLVELMGGTITGDGEPGHGCTFTFTAFFGCGASPAVSLPAESYDDADTRVLPASSFFGKQILHDALHRCHLDTLGDGVAHLNGKPSIAAALQAIRGSRVLLVEDHPINQQLAREILERAGLVVKIAANGMEAVTVLNSEQFDMVFMDIQMPVMDGYEATRIIRDRWSEETLPIIAMTAHVMAEEREKCIAAGMNDHLGKPIDIGELHRRLVSWIKPRLQVHQPPDREHTPDQATIFPTELPDIALAEGLARMNGNHDLYRKLLSEFGESALTRASELRAVLTAGDLERARQLAHQLKGVAGNLSIAKVFAAARDFEAACRMRRGEEATRTLPVLEECLAEVHVAVATLCQTEPELSDAGGETVDVSHEELWNLVAELGQRLEQRNLQALELAARLGKALGRGPHAEEAAGLVSCVEALSFPEALRQLEKLNSLIR